MHVLCAHLLRQATMRDVGRDSEARMKLRFIERERKGGTEYRYKAPKRLSRKRSDEEQGKSRRAQGKGAWRQPNVSESKKRWDTAC